MNCRTCVAQAELCVFRCVTSVAHLFYLGEKVMKKFLSAFLVLTLLLTCVACGKSEPVNTDSTTTTESTTNHTTDGEKTTESTTEENTTETKNENTTKVQKEENTKENSNTKPTEKPSSTKKPETTTKTNSKPTTTQKPSSTSKPYFVSMDVYSVDRPNSFTVNGTHILDKIYGKNTMFQNGDTITYKINMSDGGTTGFKVKYTMKCSTTISGNLVKVKVTGSEYDDFSFAITVDTKNGTETIVKNFAIYSVNNRLDTEEGMNALIKDYASSKGMILLNGSDTEPVLDYSVKVPGNSNWKSEVFATIDKCANSGYKKYCYQLVPQDAFQISMHDE